MAAYISVPRDLTKVRSRIIFNLTKRQLLCFGTAALIGVPSFFLLRNLCSVSLTTLCMIVLMLPLFFLGLYEKDGMPCEMLVLQYLRARFLRPRIRIYQTDNYYTALMRMAQAEKEVSQLVSHTEQPVR